MKKLTSLIDVRYGLLSKNQLIILPQPFCEAFTYDVHMTVHSQQEFINKANVYSLCPTLTSYMNHFIWSIMYDHFAGLAKGCS